MEDRWDLLWITSTSRKNERENIFLFDTSGVLAAHIRTATGSDNQSETSFFTVKVHSGLGRPYWSTHQQWKHYWITREITEDRLQNASVKRSELLRTDPPRLRSTDLDWYVRDAFCCCRWVAAEFDNQSSFDRHSTIEDDWDISMEWNPGWLTRDNFQGLKFQSLDRCARWSWCTAQWDIDNKQDSVGRALSSNQRRVVGMRNIEWLVSTPRKDTEFDDSGERRTSRSNSSICHSSTAVNWAIGIAMDWDTGDERNDRSMIGERVNEDRGRNK